MGGLVGLALPPLYLLGVIKSRAGGKAVHGSFCHSRADLPRLMLATSTDANLTEHLLSHRILIHGRQFNSHIAFLPMFVKLASMRSEQDP